jgi:acetyl esterase/lipase
VRAITHALILVLMLALAVHLHRVPPEYADVIPHDNAVSPALYPELRSLDGLPPGCTAQAGLVYASAGGERLQLDLLQPPGKRAAPLAIWLHPGGWHSGTRWPLGRGARELLEAGFAVATVEYRLAPAVHWPVPLEDCKRAIAFLRESADRYRVDPDRICVWGHSAGGAMAALLAMDSVNAASVRQDWAVEAACDLAGRADWLDPDLDPHARMVASMLFGADRQVAMLDASPLHQARSTAAPILILHGTSDEVVPARQATAFYDALSVPAPTRSSSWCGERITASTASIRSSSPR